MQAQTQIADYFNERIYQPARSLAAVVSGANKVRGVDFAAQGRGAGPESLSFNWAPSEEDTVMQGRHFKREGRGFYISQAIGSLERAIEGLPQASDQDLANIPAQHVNEVRQFLDEAVQRLEGYSAPGSSLMRANTSNKRRKNFKPGYIGSQQLLIAAKSRLDTLLAKYTSFADSYTGMMLRMEQAASSNSVPVPIAQSGQSYRPYTRYARYAAAAAAGVAAIYLLMSQTPGLPTTADFPGKSGGIAAPSTNYIPLHGNLLRHYKDETLYDLARRTGIPENEIGRWIFALERKNNLKATPTNDPFTAVNGQLHGDSSDPRQDKLIDFSNQLFPKGSSQMILIAPTSW